MIFLIRPEKLTTDGKCLSYGCTLRCKLCSTLCYRL